MEKSLFIRKFFEHGTQRLGSITPSSHWFAKEQTRYVTPDQPQVIVELGAGTGAVTSQIANLMHPDSTLIANEIDTDFARVLTRKVSSAEVIVGDVSEALDCLTISKIDLLVCALPLPQLPIDVTEKIFTALAELGHRDTVLTQPTLIPRTYKRVYGKLFYDVSSTRVLRNFPPGAVFHCKRLRKNFSSHLPGKI